MTVRGFGEALRSFLRVYPGRGIRSRVDRIGPHARRDESVIPNRGGLFPVVTCRFGCPGVQIIGRGLGIKTGRSSATKPTRAGAPGETRTSCDSPGRGRTAPTRRASSCARQPPGQPPAIRPAARDRCGRQGHCQRPSPAYPRGSGTVVSRGSTRGRVGGLFVQRGDRALTPTGEAGCRNRPGQPIAPWSRW